MATRNFIPDTGAGPDRQATNGHILIGRYYPGPDDTGTYIHATPQKVTFSNPLPTIPLEVGQVYTFTPVQPAGERIYAYIPAGAGDFTYADLVPVDPDSLLPSADPGPAWFVALQDVQDGFAGKQDVATLDADTAALIDTPGSAIETVVSVNYAGKTAANVFTAQQTVESLRMGEAADTIVLRDTLGTNGRRLSVGPLDTASTKSAQLELAPGSNVAPTDETQAQILLFARVGDNYERMLIDSRNQEFRIVSSRRNSGTQYPITFYLEDAAIPGSPVQTAIMKLLTNGRVRFYDRIEFGSASDTNLYRESADNLKTDDSFTVGGTLKLGAAGDATLSRLAAGILTTPGQFIVGSTARAASGTPQEIRFGNAAGTSEAAVSFGSAQDAYIVRKAANHLLTNGKFEATGVVKGLATATGSRPTASTAGVGATMFDTTLGKPIWSTGSAWVDATGATA